MTYSFNEPQATDIPAVSQGSFLTNFGLINQIFGINHIPFGNVIQLATNDNPCTFFSQNNRLNSGDTITISHLYGINENGVRSEWSINGNSYIVTVVDEDMFSIPVDTSSFDPYEANSGDFTCTIGDLADTYGFHTEINFGNNATPPNRSPPISALYTKETTENFQPFGQTSIEKKSNKLFFQNSSANEYQLTGASFTRLINNSIGVRFISSRGFITPWNLVVNFGVGFLANGVASASFPLAKTYTTTHYCTIITPTAGTGTSPTLKVSSTSLTDFNISASGTGGIGPHFNFFSIGR